MRFFIIFIIAIIIYSCTNSVQKSGLTNVDKFTMSFDGMNKNEVTKIIGTPSSIDTFNNSILYFSEIINEKNIFSNKIVSRDVYIFKFDKNNIFLKLDHFLIDNNNKITFAKKTTESEIIETGYIEKIFGGVGNRNPGARIPSAIYNK